MADVVTLLNTIRDNSSDFYQERVPLATKTNLDKVADALATYQSTQNEFLKLLINKVAMTIVNNKLIQNPLAQLKQGKMPMGKNIEEIFINPAIAKNYSMTSEEMLKVTPPDVKALYYSLNRQDKYRVTVQEPTLLQAVQSDYVMRELINYIVNSLYSGDNLDEFLLTKQLIAGAVKKGNVKIRNLEFTPDTLTSENAKSLIKHLRTDSLNMTFPSSDYNMYAKVKPEGDDGKDVITFTPVEEQVLIINSTIYSAVSVDVLATAFNMDKTNFNTKVIPVDNFNGEPILALLCDRAWFKIYDNVKRLKSMDNGDTMNIHYWLHHWQVIAHSMFANAIAYTYTPTPTV